MDRPLEARHLKHVPADHATVESLIESARRHILTASKPTADDPEGAFVLAYDSARKPSTALLAHHGPATDDDWWPHCLVETANAQFPNVPGLKSIDRLRRRRNQAEYPEPSSYDPISEDEAEEAIAVARECAEAVARLLVAPQLGVY